VKRAIKDRVIGYHRFSAYDLSEKAMRQAADVLLCFKPDYILGYSVALDCFARANKDRERALADLGIKVVIGAAERFPDARSIDRLHEMFNCPVAMEYGSVETSLIAHMTPNGGYDVFWGSFFLEAHPVSPGSSTAKVLVTSLFPRCFPLVRYDLGDEIELDAPTDTPVLGLTKFARVRGRCNDHVRLEDGTLVHSEVFTHAVRECRGVDSYQVALNGDRPRILFTSHVPNDVDVPGIRRRLSVVHSDLAGWEIVHVRTLEQTVAGKTPMIITRPSSRLE
jgi:phenylacetate-CoA ligase